ncbi:hypothetical protein [Methylocystis sp. JR02]|uniref:hypothetical protein n=1 Tax=Methylocystis sp. JR02 TaxID=3046284 RepID=UPI0024BB92B8|nr:hypothetical protein [Methylocystis sp. JR02]MDJ0450749.1 hypothetical protein [Methylocystis sp. JR02]
MAKDDLLSIYGVEPPAPHRARTSLALLFGALLASPLAWSVQLLVNYGLASHACFPSDRPRSSLAPGWEWVEPVVTALNLLCLAIAVVASLVALSVWRRTSGEAEGGHESVIDVGQGRTRFLAIWGVWGGVWFALQILFATISIIWVPACGS